MAVQFSAAREQELLKERLAAFVEGLTREAAQRVGKRQAIEERWLKDLTQYHGEYDPNETPELAQARRTGKGERSSVFMGKTRSKTNALAARLTDMLFPTEDENWDIQPTPVPSLTARAERGVAVAQRMVQEANQALDAGQGMLAERMAKAGNEFAAAAREARAVREEAARRCDAMRDEMQDQLVESRYAAECRKVIQDACKVGTGILKGPIASPRPRKQWQRQEGNVYQLRQQEDTRPGYLRVPYWNVFPDPDATCAEDSLDFFERHLLNAVEMRKIARRPGFSADAFRRLLKAGPQKQTPQFIQRMRAITGQEISADDKRWTLWEWRGSLTAEQAADICMCLGDGEGAKDYEGAIDPLAEFPVVLWFCDGEILKFGPSHMDSGDPIYSFFSIEKDEASPWGYGIPYMIRDSQRVLNAAWRGMMDNAGVSAGPQIVIDMDQVEPAPGDDHVLRAFKVWLRKGRYEAGHGRGPFEVFEINGHQAEFAAIIQLAEHFIDDETGLPMVAQGEQGAEVTKTKGGLAMLMNSANVVLRRIVRNFDDDLTVPSLRRLYDWNMQFSKREDIKGDFEVEARGSSVLVVREMESQNLMALAQFLAHPILGPMLKPLPLLRRAVQSLRLNGAEIVVTDEEWDEKQQKMAEQAQPDAEQMKLESAERVEKMRLDAQIAIAELGRETAMITLAEKRNMQLEDLRAALVKTDKELAHKERVKAVDVALAQRVNDPQPQVSVHA